MEGYGIVVDALREARRRVRRADARLAGTRLARAAAAGATFAQVVFVTTVESPTPTLLVVFSAAMVLLHLLVGVRRRQLGRDLAWLAQVERTMDEQW